MAHSHLMGEREHYGRHMNSTGLAETQQRALGSLAAEPGLGDA